MSELRHTGNGFGRDNRAHSLDGPVALPHADGQSSGPVTGLPLTGQRPVSLVGWGSTIVLGIVIWAAIVSALI